jgi:ribosomal protein L11 methyltransferase
MSKTEDILHCCEIRDESDNTAMADELFAIQGYDYSSVFDTETKETRHILYFDNGDSANLAKNFLERLPDEWSSMGLRFAEIAVSTIERKDWSEVWKKYFKVQHVSDRVVVKPSWLTYSPASDKEIVVELDPGMSFGTGKHATTRFCLREAANLADALLPGDPELTLLDAGCGSGILTIAALKLGFKNVSAFDSDSHSVVCAAENMEMNDLDPRSIDLREMDLANSAEVLEPFDIVIANMLSHILLSNKESIAKLVKPGGRLVAAGILTKEYPEFLEAFAKLGFREARSAEEDEWTGGLFLKA